MSQKKSLEEVLSEALTSPVWTVEQYQEIFSCSHTTVMRRVADKTLPSVKIGGRRYIIKQSVLEKIRNAMIEAS